MAMNTFKKTALAAALAMSALPFAANAIPGVIFDPTGAGNAGGDAALVTEMSWAAGNGLLNDLFDPSLVGSDGNGLLLAHSRLGGLVTLNGSLGFTNLFTYQLGLSMTSSNSGASTVNFNQSTGNNAVNFFRIYVDETPDYDSDNNGVGDETSMRNGTGFGDSLASGGQNNSLLTTNQRLILEGTLTLRGDSMSVSNTGGLLQDLANINGTNIATVPLTGSASFDIDVSFADSLYFISNLQQFGFDMTLDTLGPIAPFQNAVPRSTQVVGVTPYFGGVESGLSVDVNGNGVIGAGETNKSMAVNDFVCTDPADQVDGDSSPCDLQFQTGGTSQFYTNVPEPMSLALMGLGLAGIGFASRRRS